MIIPFNNVGVRYMSDKPVASFVLVLIAAIIDILFGVFTLIGGSHAVSMIGSGMASTWIARIIVLVSIWWIICGGLLFMASMWINSGEHGKARNGGIVAIIFSILSLNLIVIILGLIGGILALTWKPSTTSSTLQPANEQRPEDTI